MKILRVDMKTETVTFQDLPKKWKLIGGSGLISKIMNAEVPPDCDPLGPQNKLIIATGPLAGTMAPQLGRISVGAKSPLTLGIKEANSGGPAGQYLDKLGIRAIVFENNPEPDRLFFLKLDKDGASVLTADDYKEKKNYELVASLHERYGKKTVIISTGLAGERKYTGASVSFTDINGDPSRNAARGGLGAVMGSKGVKAIIIDPKGADSVPIADNERFKQKVKEWIYVLEHDIGCALFKKFGTPFAVANSANQGSMPYKNYTSGKPEGFRKISGEAIQKKLFERGGKMHGCMPGCVVRCSIIYPDADGNRLASAYEYEAIALLGTNLGIDDLDAIARLKYICDDLGLDLIETGSALGVAADAGKMTMGDGASAEKLLKEIEQGTAFGIALGNGVVATAKALNISRVPAYKGQAIPGHDPRAVKGTGTTYVTSPMGADHTAGLTYKSPKSKNRQAENSLRSQIQSAVCDTFGYCLNSVTGGQTSLYGFLADLMKARYGVHFTEEDVVEIGKQTLLDQLTFNKGAEFSKQTEPQQFFRLEAINKDNEVFDVEEAEIADMWKALDKYKEREKTWEIRIPPIPDILMGAGVAKTMGSRLKRLNMKKALIVSDPFMKKIGRADEISNILNSSGIDSVIFDEIVPDPPVEVIEKAGEFYKEQLCDSIVGLGGGSSMDAAKAIALRVSHSGSLDEYESIVGGTAKVKQTVPPIICVPTTSGTGSEVNPYAVITDKERNVKFMLMSNYLIPKLAVIDPEYCKSMPPGLTVESGIDALAHCIEGYVSLAIPYHPYFESLALSGTKLIGRSLPLAFNDGNNLNARSDMCMAAVFGGIAFLKGLGIGHALTHALGAHYHLPHGKAATIGLLAFAKANKETCKEPFTDLAFALNRNTDLENALNEFYKTLNISASLKDHGIPQPELKELAFYTYRDAVNMATNPTALSENNVLRLLDEMYY
ncbi:MAG: iron-containing alcohol dehydrogenase [Desulfobacterales bacterium]|nr:iron-containing alcohol dehydrogenase [Desulfobacterales bacterium]